MQTEVQIRKARGRLSRDDQRRLGDILQRVYDDVVKQGVPGRFEDLLRQLDESDPSMRPEQQNGGASERYRDDEPVAEPQDKGSRE